MKLFSKIFLLLSITASAAVLKDDSAKMSSYLSEYVVMLILPGGEGGGTGFHVKLPDGKTYIMTNNHVCGADKEYRGKGKGDPRAPFMIAKKANGQMQKTRILYSTGGSPDICILDPIQKNGLEISEGTAPYLSSSNLAQMFTYSSGHPILSTLSHTKGVLGAVQIFKINDHCNSKKTGEKTSKYTVLPYEYRGRLKRLNYCAEDRRGQISSLISLPGSSGSPVITENKKLVAIIFAGDGVVSVVVPLDDIHYTVNKFLSGK